MDYKKLKEYIDIANSRNSLPEETADDWTKWVTEPIVQHNFAPRHARAILEVFGQMADHGINIMRILKRCIPSPNTAKEKIDVK